MQTSLTSPVWQQTTPAQILAHENVHAWADEALATKALPVAVAYLKSTCRQKTWGEFLLTGSWDWTTSQCKDAMQDDADYAAGYLSNVADTTLANQAHANIGATPTSWNPQGISVFQAWFNTWLGQNFNGGKFW